MTPDAIKKKEDSFFSTLKPNSGVQFTKESEADIGGATIYSIRPPYSTYYYPTETKKKSICLHFTVGYIGSDISTLAKDGSHVSVSYVVDRCGRIYELFNDRYWSYHLGNGCVGGNSTMSKQSIGIEISNYGPLDLDKAGNLIDAYGNVYCSDSDIGLYEMVGFRGKQFFASATNEQIGAVAALVKHLCEKHGIPMAFKGDDCVFASDSIAQSFSGIFLHTNVRKDKFDWPYSETINAIVKACTEEITSEPVEITQETEDRAEQAFDETVDEDQPDESSTPVDAAPSESQAPAEKTTEGKAEPAGNSASLLWQLIEFLMSLFKK